MVIEHGVRQARLAEVMVRVGLGLRPGQRLLIAEPFELQGVSRQAAGLVEAVATAARAAGAVDVEVLWGDEERLRAAARRWPDEEFDAELGRRAAVMRAYVARGDALLHLQSSDPALMDGVSAERVARMRERCWQHYGTVAPDLVAGRTNWCVAPAPTAAWARAVYPGWGGPEALERLWTVVVAACRADREDPVGAWRAHLARLAARRDELNRRRLDRLRLRGAGTDLEVRLARGHVWRTAQLVTVGGQAFVGNLPTEEVFTAPDPESAHGVVRVACPVSYGGARLEGLELTFRRGRVVAVAAREGRELFERILATDAGSARLGEIAFVPDRGNATARDGAVFFHPLLDENARDHIAVGDAYSFTVDAAGAGAINHSLIHMDLPVDLTDRGES